MVPGETIYKEAGRGRTTALVNLRRKPDGKRMEELEKGEELTITGEVKIGADLWYHVRTREGKKGYALSEFVHVLRPVVLTPVDASIVLDKFPIVQCDPINAINSSEPFYYTEAELSKYRTLNVGMVNSDVLALKRRLYELGYFAKPNENSRYTESTADVIRQFQRDNSLPRTGEADPHTQAMLFDERVLPKVGSPVELKYLDTRSADMWIQRAEVSSFSFSGSVQVSIRNNTGAKLSRFTLKVIPYYSTGEAADMADTFAEEIEREYPSLKISIADGRSYSDFYVPDPEDYEDEDEDGYVNEEWDEIVNGGGSEGIEFWSDYPHHFQISRKNYFSGAQIAVASYRTGGKNVYVDDDQMIFVPAGKGVGESLIRTLPIEVSAEEAERAKWTMGVTTRYVLPVYQEHYNLPQGAWIKEVDKGSPAHDAGLKPGDIIAGVGDITILGDATLRKTRASIAPGESAVVTFWREGKYYETELFRPEEE